MEMLPSIIKTEKPLPETLSMVRKQAKEPSSIKMELFSKENLCMTFLTGEVFSNIQRSWFMMACSKKAQRMAEVSFNLN